jgi:hypothetical protein
MNYKPLSAVDVDVRIQSDKLPIDLSGDLFSSGGGVAPSRLDGVERQFSWEPAELTYQPLYFDDVPLERYGQRVHPLIQPWLSGARFFGTFPIMPYKMTLNHPFSRVTPYGLYRPGSPTPLIRTNLPLRVDAATAEAATWVAMIFLLP